MKIKKKSPVKQVVDPKNIYTGPAKTDPGVLKAKADKKATDARLAIIKKEAAVRNAAVVKKAKSKARL